MSTRQRLAAGEGGLACTRSRLAWLERQAEAAEDLLAERRQRIAPTPNA